MLLYVSLCMPRVCKHLAAECTHKITHTAVHKTVPALCEFRTETYTACTHSRNVTPRSLRGWRTRQHKRTLRDACSPKDRVVPKTHTPHSATIQHSRSRICRGIIVRDYDCFKVLTSMRTRTLPPLHHRHEHRPEHEILL